MIEVPESLTVARQVAEHFAGCKITGVFNATQLHKFTWYAGDPLKYPHIMIGRKILTAEGHGAFVDLHMDADVHLSVSDGVNVRWYAPGAEIPQKYQLLITLEDNSFLVFTVAMYGGILAYHGVLENPYHTGAVAKVSPLDERFDMAYFESLFTGCKKNCSVKAFLATEQRIPGLGNGVLQDILFCARIHPKQKLSGLCSGQLEGLFASLKTTLADMTAKGGRDTEKDLFGNSGSYQTLLSKNTLSDPCPVCGGKITKEPYLGGAVYYCPVCQAIK